MPDRDDHGLNPLGGPLDPLAMIHMDLRLFRREQGEAMAAFRRETAESIARLATREDVAHEARRQDERLEDHRRRTDEKMADLGADIVNEGRLRAEADVAVAAAAKDAAQRAAVEATAKLEAQQKATRRWVLGAVLVPIGLFVATLLGPFMGGGAP